MADSVDMLGDAIVYVLSLYALSRGPRLGSRRGPGQGRPDPGAGRRHPIGDRRQDRQRRAAVEPGLMLMFGSLALVANLSCLGLAVAVPQDQHQHEQYLRVLGKRRWPPTSACWLLRAWSPGPPSPWPDIVVGGLIALLFLRSSLLVLREAWPAWRASGSAAPAQRQG
ncbi:hypothetical protein ACRAWD_05340 [Caulobacter segnis]